MKAYLELTKPRITWLILMSTAVGFVFGAREQWSWWTLFHTVLGTGLIASGTAALNQWFEREADARMRRTCERPIPSGRVAAPNAFWFGVALSLFGLIDLAAGANVLTAILGLVTIASYLLVYTPLKKRSWLSTTAGAFPGAMPPLIGYAAAAGALAPEAWILYAILFLWQFPHFYAIAWLYREDYARAGIRMLPVVEPDGESTARQILWTSLLLIPVSLAPRWLGMSGNLYAAGALLLGLYFFRAGLSVVNNHSNQQARRVLIASVVYLPVLYAVMVLDRFTL